jgi:HemY protein
MEVDGGATVDVAGQEFTLSPLEMVFALVALVVAVWLGLKLLALLVATFKFLNGDETAISRYFDRNRERKGYEALSEGMMALASGEGHLALTKAVRADKYLHQPQLTNLLTAQAAEMTGDRRKAEETYKKLLADSKTRFVGVRGIMKQKLADGDTDTALALAKKAFALKPKHEET